MFGVKFMSLSTCSLKFLSFPSDLKLLLTSHNKNERSQVHASSKDFFAEKNRQITKAYKQFDSIHIKFKALKTVLCVV